MKTLIVGGGLAGITLAETLINRGIKVTVMHSADRPSSTLVATGMYNPIVFRRINHSWMIHELKDVFIPFYESLSAKLGEQLIAPIQLEKQIQSADYELLWNKKAKEEAFLPYIKPVVDGAGEVLQAGMVDTRLLMNAYLEHLDSKSLLITSVFDEDALESRNGKLVYGSNEYDRIILAQGVHAAGGKLFGWLPFKICKGEWIRIKAVSGLTDGKVINNVLNIIPEADGLYKLSSTFSWEDLNWNTTDVAQKQLCQMFEKTFDVPYEVVESQAGLRPTVADRRPYLGEHPSIKGLYIFNGLGSKGVMLAPYFAEHLAHHILDGSPLMPEVNIQRHIKRFLNTSTQGGG